VSPAATPKDAPPPLGFEFRFRRAPDSVGYNSATSEAVSVYKLRLDVKPVTLGWPSYQYR
jgi:cyanophycinase